MPYVVAFIVMLLSAAIAQAQNLELGTAKYPKSEYPVGYHYGSVKFNMLAYARSAPTQTEWQDVIFKRVFGSQEEAGSYAFVIDLCDPTTACDKPIVRKPIAVFTKRPNQKVKPANLWNNIFASTEPNLEVDATTEENYINRGQHLWNQKLIGSKTTDNRYIIRLGLIQLDEIVVKKGIVLDLITISNGAADNPIIKASSFAIPGAPAVSEVTKAVQSLAEKLMPQTASLRKLTNDVSMQFVDEGGYPRFQQFYAPSKLGSAHDCKEKPGKRENCIVVQVEFSTDRSIFSTFNNTSGKFDRNPSATDIITAASKALNRPIDDYLGEKHPSLKAFFSTVGIGPYNDKDKLVEACTLLKRYAHQDFTRWDASALYWAFLTEYWTNLKNNTRVADCLGSSADKQQFVSMGLNLPTP